MFPPASEFFSVPRPALLPLPHLLTALDAELLGEVSHLTAGTPGIWPLPAPYDAEDRFNPAREAAPLAAWALPLNQGEILSFSPFIQEAVFGGKLLFVEAQTSEATLQRLAVTPGRRLESGAWMTQGYEDLADLPLLLNTCRWALIPIGPERSRALFVADARAAAWVAQLAEWCDRDGRSRAEFRWEAGQLILSEHPASPAARAKAWARQIDTFLGRMEVYFGAVDETIPDEVARRIEARRALRRQIEQAKNPRPAG